MGKSSENNQTRTQMTISTDDADMERSMNDSNAIAECESTETVGIWRRAVLSELTFGDS